MAAESARSTPDALAGVDPGAIDGTVVGAGRVPCAWSRCNPRARPARAPRRGATAPARRPTSGWARERARRGRPSARRRRARRIDAEGAYANLVLPPLLARSGLSDRDRAFVTELVYGTTRMRRACDWLVDRFLARPRPSPRRALLRLGAYQLAFLDTPAHAAVAATVRRRRRGCGPLNAVLRKVAGAAGRVARRRHPPQLPRLARRAARRRPRRRRRDGRPRRHERAAAVTARDDGYVQDLASQWVADAVARAPGERVLDLCAAPGGKATGLAGAGAMVVAADARARRVGLVARNAASLEHGPDRRGRGGRRRPAPPFRPGSFDRVLLDAPCSGLGALRRRPDARWRIEADAVERLAGAAARLAAAAALVRPGGMLVYSVCTLTAAETIERRPVARRAPAPSSRPLRSAGASRGGRSGAGASCSRRPRTPTACTCCASGCPGQRLRRSAQTRLTDHAHERPGRVPPGQGAHRVRRGGRGHPEDRRAGRWSSACPPTASTSSTVVVADGRESVGEALVELPRASPARRHHRRHRLRPRDLTRRAPGVVLDREAPGLAEAMRLVNPLGGSPAAVAGTRGTALILNLPGSTAGAVECLDAVLDVVPHALRSWPATDRGTGEAFVPRTRRGRRPPCHRWPEAAAVAADTIVPHHDHSR